MHVDETYLDDHDVAVRAGSFKRSNLAAVTLSPAPALLPTPQVTAQREPCVNTNTGETFDFWLRLCASRPLVAPQAFGSLLPSKEFVTPVCNQVRQELIVKEENT